jgi:hypothetical protein
VGASVDYPAGGDTHLLDVDVGADERLSDHVGQPLLERLDPAQQVFQAGHALLQVGDGISSPSGISGIVAGQGLGVLAGGTEPLAVLLADGCLTDSERARRRRLGLVLPDGSGDLDLTYRGPRHGQQV